MASIDEAISSLTSGDLKRFQDAYDKNVLNEEWCEYHNLGYMVLTPDRMRMARQITYSDLFGS